MPSRVLCPHCGERLAWRQLLLLSSFSQVSCRSCFGKSVPSRLLLAASTPVFAIFAGLPALMLQEHGRQTGNDLFALASFAVLVPAFTLYVHGLSHLVRLRAVGVKSGL